MVAPSTAPLLRTPANGQLRLAHDVAVSPIFAVPVPGGQPWGRFSPDRCSIGHPESLPLQECQGPWPFGRS